MIYIGEGKHIVGVPARDLTETDLKNLAMKGWTERKLTDTGLYKKEYNRKVNYGIKRTKKDSDS